MLVSASLHVVVLALMIFGLPLPHRTPDEPEAVKVELVPPPEESKSEEEAAQEAEDEQPAPPEETASADPARPPPQLRPVFQFGDKDAGPKKADDGSAASEARPAAVAPAREPAPPPALQGLETPEAEIAASEQAPEPPAEARQERKLHSSADTGDTVATTAMNALPRGVRAGELCATELRERLRRAMPPYWPDLLPAYRLDKGTVLQVRKGAFRAEARWYDLSFRCEIDAEATRVVSFEFLVGEPVPRSQWKSRGFPSS